MDFMFEGGGGGGGRPGVVPVTRRAGTCTYTYVCRLRQLVCANEHVCVQCVHEQACM